MLKRMQKSQKFKILNAKIRDERFLFNIYNENVTQKKFYTNRIVNYANHQVWMKKQLNERSTYIIYLKKKLAMLDLAKLNIKTLKYRLQLTQNTKGWE